MEDENEVIPVSENSSFLSQGWNLIGVMVIVALFAFIVGNRWSDIYSNLFDSGSKTENTTLPEDLDYSSVEALYDTLRREYDGQLNLDGLIDGLKDGLADAAGDPYTVYLNEDDTQKFKDDLNGSFTGIGAELGLDDEERVIIVAPLDGFPAQVAGLRAQDIIAEIDGEDAYGISIEEAVTRIRGEKGTDVTLTIVRNGNSEEITITRAEITIPSVKYEITDDNFGYLQISRFADDTVSLARGAADVFRDAGVSGVILDLRNNSGGFLSGAVDISGLWISNQDIVEQRRGDTVEETLRSNGSSPLADFPTIVLINEGSASASEIVAGALQDYQAATLVGMTSFGKGSVQALEELKDGGVLKVTIARWYTPNGRNIDHEGIEPDIKVEFTEEDYENDNDPQLNTAKELLK